MLRKALWRKRIAPSWPSGHVEADAKKLIDQALATGTKFKDTETLIQLIYKRQFGS